MKERLLARSAAIPASCSTSFDEPPLDTADFRAWLAERQAEIAAECEFVETARHHLSDRSLLHLIAGASDPEDEK